MNKDERLAQRRQAIEDYRASGLTQKAFCTSRDIPITTLRYWLHAERALAKRGSEGMVAVGIATQHSVSRALRIRVNDRVVIEVDMPIDRGQLDTVLRAVSAL